MLLSQGVCASSSNLISFRAPKSGNLGKGVNLNFCKEILVFLSCTLEVHHDIITISMNGLQITRTDSSY